MQIRPEQPADIEAIFALHTAAFGQPGEAKLVDALRQQATPFVSLVAANDVAVVGHIAFSPVTLEGHGNLKIMGLAPMAVANVCQRQGIGLALMKEGLAQCQRLGFGAVVVLGHPSYYPRAGFVPAQDFGIRCVYDAPPEAFMLMELVPGYLQNASGTIAYHQAFAMFE
ncbi:MAG: N-acetyltransferase [Pirellulales bacterium]